MYNIDEEFAKYQEKVEKENKKYEKCEISADNFTFPHIFLTDEEIIEFNAECKRSKIDLQVIPLSEYMNISLIDKEERDINEDMKFIDNCYIPKKEDYEEEKKEEDHKTINKKNINNEKMNLGDIIKNVNEYIGKKQKRIINDDYDESDVSDEKSQKTIFSFKSSIEFSKNKLKKEKEKEKEKEKDNKDMKNTNKNKNKNKNKSRDRLKKAEKDDKNHKKKKIVPKKDENSNNNNKNIIDRYFKK